MDVTSIRDFHQESREVVSRVRDEGGSTKMPGRPILGEETAVRLGFRVPPAKAEQYADAAKARGIDNFSEYVRWVLDQDLAKLNQKEAAA